MVRRWATTYGARVTTDPMVHMQLDLTFKEGTLIGQIGVGETSPRPFTGWIGLIATIDELLLAQRRGCVPAAGAVGGPEGV